MRRFRVRWIGVSLILAGLAAAAAAAWLAFYLRSRGLDWASKFSEVASFVLAAATILMSLVGKIVHWLPAPRITDQQIDTDAADLAAALRIQGRFEGVLSGRYVYDRLPMPVRWTQTEQFSYAPARGEPSPSLLDPGGGITGTFDQVLEYFKQLPEARLLVLGPAGSGKTVLVTELARRLLATWRTGQAVPVIIPLAAWDPSQKSLFDWISEQLTRINADLSRPVSDGRRIITRAQALVDRMKVLPILDGLDEIDEAASPVATTAINRYGWAQPLVLTCRTDRYIQLVGTEQGTPVAQVAVTTLLPLELVDIKGYLGPDQDSHWAAVYDRLDAEPDGPLAQALANPLMLWLAWAVHTGTGRDPEELTDWHRFASAAAIERHLLAEFVPAVYPDSKKRRAGPLRRRQVARVQPLQWLGFLAADRYLHPKPSSLPGARPPFETRDVQNVAWWRFPDAAPRGFRIVSVAVRGTLIWIVFWELAIHVLRHYGGVPRNWSDIHYRNLFLSGPVGRDIWPTIDRVINLVPEKTRQDTFSAANQFLRTIPIQISPLTVVIGILIVSAIATYIFDDIRLRPRRLRIRPKLVMTYLISVLVRALLIVGTIFLVMLIWHQTSQAAGFFSLTSTWLTILAISLAMGVSNFPGLLTTPIDVVGAIRPIESLRLDRWADAVVTMSRRAIFAGVVLLFSGPQLALAYAVLAGVCTLIALVLGGCSIASRSYTDACLWLGLTRRMPWRPMRFLLDAERRGVFVEIGSIYRFRHGRVQLQLRGWYEDHRPPLRQWEPRRRRLVDRVRTYAGNRADTLSGARDRVDSYRRLADKNMPVFGPLLADALSTEASLLQKLGYRGAELDALMQLVATRRRLAEASADGKPELAGAQARLAHRLAEAGRYGEAFSVMTEAAEIYCQSPHFLYRSDFEDALFWLQRESERTGGSIAAAGTVETIVNRYRQSVRAECAADPEDRVAALTQLARILRRLGFDDDAADAINEAAIICGQPAHNDSYSHKARLAESLRKLAGQLEELNRKDDAATAIARSADIYRDLARLEPKTYRFSLLDSLNQLATLFSELDQPAEVAVIREAVSAYQAMTEAEMSLGPGLSETNVRHELALGWLSHFALRLWQLALRDEAVEAARIGRQLAAADSLSTFFSTRRLVWDGSLGPRRRPVSVRLIMQFQDRFDLYSLENYSEPELTVMLRSRAMRLGRWLGRLMGRASWELELAVALRSRVEEHDEWAFRFLLAGREDESRTEAAIAAGFSREVVAAYRRLSSTKPAVYLAALADSLDLLAAQLRKAGMGDIEAEAADGEAQLIRRQLGLAHAQEPHCD